MKKKTILQIIEAAKKRPLHDFAAEVSADEIQEGLKIYAWPIKFNEYDELQKLMKDEATRQWALVLITIKDLDGVRLFTVDDIEFLETIGLRFKARLYATCSKVSRLTEAATTEKK